MSERRGLPIAAHLGLLVALAFASAFVVMLAVIIWLPPRPPDVMRADQLIDAFAQGYAQAQAGERPSNRSMTWRFVSHAPVLDPEALEGPIAGVGASLAQ